mmetsp:Transcript_33415/g.95910  ORF Transcript_33415/g.95910 Transcript_33415/m.95910 type:complete len:330 (-) Transcript_33415:341-1330(-)
MTSALAARNNCADKKSATPISPYLGKVATCICEKLGPRWNLPMPTTLSVFGSRTTSTKPLVKSTSPARSGGVAAPSAAARMSLLLGAALPRALMNCATLKASSVSPGRTSKRTPDSKTRSWRHSERGWRLSSTVNFSGLCVFPEFCDGAQPPLFCTGMLAAGFGNVKWKMLTSPSLPMKCFSAPASSPTLVNNVREALFLAKISATSVVIPRVAAESNVAFSKYLPKPSRWYFFSTATAILAVPGSSFKQTYLATPANSSVARSTATMAKSIAKFTCVSRLINMGGNRDVMPKKRLARSSNVCASKKSASRWSSSGVMGRTSIVKPFAG